MSLAEVGCALWLNWEKVAVESTTITNRYAMRTCGSPQKELHDTGFEKFINCRLVPSIMINDCRSLLPSQCANKSCLWQVCLGKIKQSSFHTALTEK